MNPEPPVCTGPAPPAQSRLAEEHVGSRKMCRNRVRNAEPVGPQRKMYGSICTALRFKHYIDRKAVYYYYFSSCERLLINERKLVDGMFNR